MTSPNGVTVEVLGPAELESRLQAWNELAANALVPNAFYEPWLAMEALKAEDQPAHLHFVFISGPAAGSAPAPLWGLFPLRRQARCMHLPLNNLAFWEHRFCYLTVPLLHRDHTWAVLDAFWRWFESNPLNCHILDTNHLLADGVFHEIWSDFAIGRTKFQLHDYPRAFLAPAPGATPYISRSNARKRKRLEALGTLECVELHDPALAPEWVDRFLDMEAGGWKGADGGRAFAKDPRDRRFLHDITRQGLETGRVECLSLNLNGTPIAMKHNFLARDGGFAFRIAFDEAYAKHSPGTLLEIETVRRHCDNPARRWLDSCAAPRNPLYRHIWTESRMIRRTLFSNGSRRGDLLCSLLPLLRFARGIVYPHGGEAYFRVSTESPQRQGE